MRKLIILLTGIMTIMMMTSCTEFAKKEPLSEAESCIQLTEIIADHPNKFAKHKQKKRVVRHYVSWTTSSPFPTAENCEIWEWSTGLNSFICHWKQKDGMDSAKQSYQEGNQIIQSCLSDGWQVESTKTSTGGEHSRYTKQGLKTIVSIRYFKPTGLFDNWKTTLYIGDKNNLNAKTQ